MENKVIALIIMLIFFTPSILAMYKTYKDDGEVIETLCVGVVWFLFTTLVVFIMCIIYQVVFDVISHSVRG